MGSCCATTYKNGTAALNETVTSTAYEKGAAALNVTVTYDGAGQYEIRVIHDTLTRTRASG